jgi:hypothetical protein
MRRAPPAGRSSAGSGLLTWMLSNEPDDIVLPMLSDVMRARLIEYVERFKAGDFDAVRAILAGDVKLDLVA